MWDWYVFVIGLLVGMIVLLLLVWFCYATRIFVFTYCPRQIPPCGYADYYSDPGQALANGSSPNDILFVNSSGELYYRRPTRSVYCTPGAEQAVYISYPQYCTFTDEDNNQYQGKSLTPGSSTYRVALNDNGTDRVVEVATNPNCQPKDSTYFTCGKPIPQWDKAAFLPVQER